ncbi:MAG: dihydrodipicolinate synthase family protein [Ruminiclostridium sp.]
MLKGNLVLLVTPFNKDYQIDEKSFVNLLDYVVEGNVQGVIVLGTSGEFFSLRNEEKKRIIDITSERIGDKCAMISGVAHSGSFISADLAKYAGSKGAAAVLAPPPYYIQPTNEGMINHFTIIAERGGVDLMVYDGGGGIEVPISVIDGVRKNSSKMKYIKLTTPKPGKVKELHTAFNREVSVFAGEDLLIMPDLYEGAVGLTTAAGNLRPDVLTKIFELVQDKKYEEAQKLHDEFVAPQAIVTGSIRNEFIQCFKTALKMMGIIECDIVRPPLHQLSEVRRNNLKLMLQKQKLLI